MADINALRIELDAGHPDTGAYDPDPQIAADQINLQNRTVSAAGISSRQIVNAIVPTEYALLSSVQRDFLALILSSNEIDPDNPNTRSALAQIFTAGTTTRANIIQLSRRTVSRAEELGLGTIRPGEINMARAL